MSQTKPNIIWITLDSVRADRASVHGYERETTPHLERIASLADGRAFDDCISHGMWSLASDASVLTGTYPAHHGVGLHNETLPSELDTVPELFGAAGYRTAGLSFNGYFNESTGLDRGFDEFQWVNPTDYTKMLTRPLFYRYLSNVRKHSNGYLSLNRRDRYGFFEREMAKQQVDDLADDDPFFFFAHFQGAHVPYSPPLSHLDRFTDDIEMSTEEAAEFAYEVSDNYYAEMADGCEFTERETAAIDAMYDALVAYVDEQVGALFDYIRSSDLGETVVVITADHGDLLGENGLFAHQISLHDGLVNVPLVVYGSDALLDTDTEVVQHIDVLQTLLSSVGGRTEQLQGVDLRDEERELALAQRGSETYQTAMQEIKQHNPQFDDSGFHSERMHSVRGTEFKLCRSADATELFALPDERTDVAAEYPDVVARYESYLETKLDEFATLDTADSQDVSQDVKQQLADMGYVVE